MKLSIFPAANPHPRSKEEKRVEAFKFSSPHLPEAVEFNTENDLIKYVTEHCWSPFVFSGPRHADYFVSCDLLVYDIDEGLTIDEAKEKVQKLGLACLCLPSPSHSEEAHRFRIILPLARTIFSPETYAATWDKGAEIFGTVDPQAKDLARAYFGSTMDDGFWEEGAFYEPVAPAKKAKEMGPEVRHEMLPVNGDIAETIAAIYGEERSYIPEAVDFFIRNAHTGLPGQWINALNRFCFSLALSGVQKDAILALCNQLAPEELDKRDMYQIERAIKDAEEEL
jgi:hypothetical protein